MIGLQEMADSTYLPCEWSIFLKLCDQILKLFIQEPSWCHYVNVWKFLTWSTCLQCISIHPYLWICWYLLQPHGRPSSMPWGEIEGTVSLMLGDLGIIQMNPDACRSEFVHISASRFLFIQGKTVSPNLQRTGHGLVRLVGSAHLKQWWKWCGHLAAHWFNRSGCRA